MSKHKIVELKCPKCGNTSQTTVWNSLNVQKDPEAKKELLRGKINLFHCDSCSFEAFVPADLMYHDMRKKFVVQLYTLPRTEDNDFFDMFTDDAQLKSVLDIPPNLSNIVSPYFRNIHIVFAMDELVRYVVFRDRLARYKARTKDGG